MPRLFSILSQGVPDISSSGDKGL